MTDRTTESVSDGLHTFNPFQPKLILVHRKNKFNVNCV